MSNKVVLILVDGMASYCLKKCTHPFIPTMLAKGISNLHSTTVMPSVTLPCHMSLFHSVTPQRHGILTNTYVPQVRPVSGLMEQLRQQKKVAAFFYNWEELRDLSRPGSLEHSCFISLHQSKQSDMLLTNKAIEYMGSSSPDFLFLYLGETDEAGHQYGWGSSEYQKVLYDAWNCIEKVYHAAGDTYKIIVTADHGGHDYCHGTEDPRDMEIPIILSGVPASANKDTMASANIIDIAPTIAALLGIEAGEDWRGKRLI